MAELIATEKLIKKAQKNGIDFGKGNPYNRLRYYTKLGWLPHMTRQKDKAGNVVGHYPDWVIERLDYIQDLKDKGLSNDEISEKIKGLNARRNILKTLNIFKSPERRRKTISYISFIILVFILLIETGVLPFGQIKSDLIQNSTQIRNSPNQILDSGTGLFPTNEKIIYIRTKNITPTSKVSVTFEGNFDPANNYWISKKIPYEGFYLELDSPIRTNTTFNWFITN